MSSHTPEHEPPVSPMTELERIGEMSGVNPDELSGMRPQHDPAAEFSEGFDQDGVVGSVAPSENAPSGSSIPDISDDYTGLRISAASRQGLSSNAKQAARALDRLAEIESGNPLVAFSRLDKLKSNAPLHTAIFERCKAAFQLEFTTISEAATKETALETLAVIADLADTLIESEFQLSQLSAFSGSVYCVGRTLTDAEGSELVELFDRVDQLMTDRAVLTQYRDVCADSQMIAIIRELKAGKISAGEADVLLSLPDKRVMKTDTDRILLDAVSYLVSRRLYTEGYHIARHLKKQSYIVKLREVITLRERRSSTDTISWNDL